MVNMEQIDIFIIFYDTIEGSVSENIMKNVPYGSNNFEEYIWLFNQNG